MIRLFAATDGSVSGELALAYLPAMMRVAPVRVISMTGGAVGAWEPRASLLMTPIVGDYVNVVCCHPSRWTWDAVVPMTEEDAAPGRTASPAGYAERVEELYTPKVRNVLLMAEAPLTRAQMLTAQKYQARVTPSLEVCEIWESRYPMHPVMISVAPAPGFEAIRRAITGE